MKGKKMCNIQWLENTDFKWLHKKGLFYYTQLPVITTEHQCCNLICVFKCKVHGAARCTVFFKSSLWWILMFGWTVSVVHSTAYPETLMSGLVYPEKRNLPRISSPSFWPRWKTWQNTSKSCNWGSQNDAMLHRCDKSFDCLIYSGAKKVFDQFFINFLQDFGQILFCATAYSAVHLH